MQMQNGNSKVYNMVVTAMMMCLIMVAILVLRIPIPFTQGYVNLSDAMIFMAVVILGWKYGAVAAGLGAMLGDLISGFAMWAPWTLGIKAIMAIIFGLILQAACSKKDISSRGFRTAIIIGMIVSGLFMAAGYFVAEGIMYGNWAIAALGIPWNIGQFAVGGALALALDAALMRTSLRSRMAYVMPMNS